jgi:hypothetical protein
VTFGWVALALFDVGRSACCAAEKRIALLIGNKDYKPGVGALVNPLNDVRVRSAEGHRVRGAEARSECQARR